MKIRWTTEATDNLEHIRRHIEEDNPEAALKTVRSIFDHIKKPDRGELIDHDEVVARFERPPGILHTSAGTSKKITPKQP